MYQPPRRTIDKLDRHRRGGSNVFPEAIWSITRPAAIKPAVPVTKQAVPKAPSQRRKDDVSFSTDGDSCF